MSEKPYEVKCLKAIGINGVPYAKDEVVMVSEKDARDLVIRKRVIAMNFHIEYKRDNNLVQVNEGVTKKQAEKIAAYKEKEKKEPEKKALAKA